MFIILGPGIELQLPRMRHNDDVLLQGKDFILVVYFLQTQKCISNLDDRIVHAFDVICEQMLEFEENKIVLHRIVDIPT